VGTRVSRLAVTLVSEAGGRGPVAEAGGRVSVVIIARNEEEHIARCIESVRAAGRQIADLEVVLVDSCSTDGTVAVAAQFPIRIVQLSPRVRTTPAMGRCVGGLVTSGRYVQFVDGDTTLAPDWLNQALAVLQARAAYAGVAGREDQQYYVRGQARGGKPDYFATGEREQEVRQLGGNGMYRRSALEAVGSFNPFLRSYEEAELGARLRRAGWKLLRVPALMGQHHTPPPDAIAEYWRRLRTHLLTGQGQVLRLAIRQGTLREHLGSLNRPLLFAAWLALGAGATAGAFLGGHQVPVLAWAAASAVLLVAFMVRSRSASKPFKMLLDWSVCAPPLLWGLCLPARDARAFSPQEAIAADSGEGIAAVTAGRAGTRCG
jgi:hypothetical protein